MARKIKSIPGERHSKRKYPWGYWMDGRPTEIRKGKDFTCGEATMRTAIHKMAKIMGGSATVRKIRDGVLALQFHPEK